MNDETNPTSLLALLIDAQEAELRETMDDCSQKLERLSEPKDSLGQMGDFVSEPIDAIVTIMRNKKKFRNMVIKMVIVGLVMDIAWIGGLIYGIASGIWWLFVIGLVFAIVVGITITRCFYTHIAYICPDYRTIFRPPLRQMLFAAHIPKHGEMRKLVCPTCGKKQWCLGVYAPDAKPRHVGKYLIWDNESE